jgi:Vacuolar membrane-associated protein Iml1
MVATGLLSLNVHEALHFDGTPICLHPDLFSTTSTDMQSYHTTTTTTNAASSIATTIVAGNHRFMNKSLLLPLNPTMTSDEGGTTTTTTMKGIGVLPSMSNLSTENKGLQVGDLLEIRVWDPLKTQQSQPNKSTTSNISSIIRQRDQSTLNVPTNVELNDVVTSQAGSDLVNTTAPSPPMSQQKSPILPSNVATTAPLTKPPLQRRATTSLPLDAASKVSTIRASNKQQVPISGHVRDISDMTIDTVDDGSTNNGGANTTNNNNTNNTYNSQSPPMSSDQSASSDPLVVTRVGKYNDNNMNKNDDAYDDECMIMTMSQTHQLRLSFIMLVTEKTLTSLKGSARTQISILRPVADLYKLSSYDMVSVHVLNKEDDDDLIARNVAVDFLLVTIKDQFISRGDMHYFQESLIGSWIYQGERLYESTRGLQANAREIRRSAEHVLSGIVTSKTVITFRSRSSRIIWLVQISSEMWDYGPYERNTDESVCETYFDKWITFIHKLFTKWKELEATHALTVVFFSRTYLSSNQSNAQFTEQQDVYGRFYEDHFRIVLENETCTDWHSLVVRIKEAFVRYPLEVGWTLSNEAYTRRPSTASHGNVLEAINVTLNLLQFHYLDRDLQRTGNSIVLVSAGNGVFEVDRNLAGITYQVRV